jgi:hypothetical protein
VEVTSGGAEDEHTFRCGSIQRSWPLHLFQNGGCRTPCPQLSCAGTECCAHRISLGRQSYAFDSGRSISLEAWQPVAHSPLCRWGQDSCSSTSFLLLEAPTTNPRVQGQIGPTPPRIAQHVLDVLYTAGRESCRHPIPTSVPGSYGRDFVRRLLTPHRQRHHPAARRPSRRCRR